MADVVVLGGGGHARVVVQLLGSLGHRAVGYAAPAPVAGVAATWLGTDDELLGGERTGTTVGAVGIGKTDARDVRAVLVERYEAAGFRFPVLTAPSATVHEDVAVGPGTVVLSGAVVVTGSRLGRACIVNTHASVDHDCELADDVHVAPGATLCGGVQVGAHTLIGAGATVLPGVAIAERCVVAAGATVVRSIDRPGVYAGTPARRIG